MIKQETLTNGFVRTYSDMGYEIKSLTSGDVFLEAVDAPEWNAEYEEIIPEPEPETETETDVETEIEEAPTEDIIEENI